MPKDISIVRVYKLTCNYVPVKGDECQKDGVYRILICSTEYAIACKLHYETMKQEAIDNFELP